MSWGPQSDPLESHLGRLLLAQERVDALRNNAVRRFGKSLCDLAYANAYDGPTPDTLEALRKALVARGSLDFQYTPYGGGTVPRRLVAESLRDSHDAPFQLNDIVLTPGAMAALNMVFRSLVSSGSDEVIVITPCWLDYPLYLENLGLKARLVPLDRATLRLDIGAIEAALTPHTRAVVLSQPANPSGLIYNAAELRALGECLERAPSPPLLISDECHREILFDEHRFVSPTAHYAKSCVVYSFGKRLFLQGQRLGYVAVSPRHPERSSFSELLRRLIRIMGYCSPTALMQLAIGDLLRVSPSFDAIAQRRGRLLEGLHRAGYELPEPESTFFVYPRAPGGDDFAFAERAAERGVLVLPSAMFHDHGHFRISLTATDDMVDRSLPILHALREES
ncbi:MAG TPA: aminotransferase class I/II-fold pyridoxal phosphate-dependent enzyme [Polyangiaceae bacterium]|nr:aminotransferase class I/II-fold pyridoxal phosphate-dependent enzyme [Polyangiaceae bacterium]